MKNKKVYLIIASMIPVLAFLSVTVIPLMSDPVQTRFFSTIDELSHLDSYVKEELSSQDDSYLKDLRVQDSYTKLIEYNGKTYRLYAYVFEDTESARQYFERKTGVRTSTDWDMRYSSNIYFSSMYIAYHENCLYRIEGGSYVNFVKAVNLVNDPFSITLKSLQSEATE